jgi:putative oxidoreductase
MFRRLLRIAPVSLDFGLLTLRVASAGIMLTHGWPKVSNFNERFHNFGDPYGLGPEITFLFAVLAEFFCAILVGLGLVTRYALIPLIITMTTVVFIVHADDPFARKEVPSLLLTCFVTLFFCGPGRFSFDARMK